MAVSHANFERSVFINCPFDKAYREIFRGIVFTFQYVGLIPRCSLESLNSADSRFNKLASLIGSSKFGIHDISRIPATPKELPRFNMPLELGLDLGCKKFGSRIHQKKSQLVLDATEHRYDQTLSDLSGQDISCHHNDPELAITAVRNWLVRAGIGKVDSPNTIQSKYRQFQKELPKICKEEGHSVAELEFVDFTRIASEWLSESLT